MADVYRDTPCDACGKSHTLYDTSTVRYSPGGVYSYTCPTTGLLVEVRCRRAPEVVAVVPDDAVPMEWVRD
jgi:hypothetical protein